VSLQNMRIPQNYCTVLRRLSLVSWLFLRDRSHSLYLYFCFSRSRDNMLTDGYCSKLSTS